MDVVASQQSAVRERVEGVAGAGERIAGVFELFSIGIGPSSSHTVGPMRAAREFALECAALFPGTAPDALAVDVYGSLAATGRGHNTFGAILLGLEGCEPETIEPEAGRRRVAELDGGARLRLVGAGPAEHPGLRFSTADIAKHPLVVRGRYANEVAFEARYGGRIHAAAYYSIGGGFILRVLTEATADASDGREAGREEMSAGPLGRVASVDPRGVAVGAGGLGVGARGSDGAGSDGAGSDGAGSEGAREGEREPGAGARGDAGRGESGPAGLMTDRRPSQAMAADGGGAGVVASLAGAEPFPFGSGEELLGVCRGAGLAVHELVLANEASRHPGGEAGVLEGLHRIWQVMRECIEAGLSTEGVLPGGLKVPRRAARLAKALAAEGAENTPEWATIAAMAVNEENAAGNRVVTAPTNGAAGIVPAVLYHALRHRHPGAFDGAAARRDIEVYLLTAAAIGGIIKQRASISGADVGCQGEVGSASAMAAAGLAALLGADVGQVENAAEVAMEHHLGLTCDPIGGLVQIPCIERNGVAAVTAITAAKLALGGDGAHRVSFDQVVETMRQTGADMSEKYRETSRGGLAVNVPEC